MVINQIVRIVCAFVIGLPILVAASVAHSQSAPTTEELAEQIQILKHDYEKRIAELEAQVEALKGESRVADTVLAPTPTARPSRQVADNSFNPAIGVVFNGMLSEYSEKHSEIPGFQLGHHGERADEGLALGHSEITLSGNIDDKFFGNLTLGLGRACGRADRARTGGSVYPDSCPGPVCRTAFASRRGVHCGHSAT